MRGVRSGYGVDRCALMCFGPVLCMDNISTHTHTRTHQQSCCLWLPIKQKDKVFSYVMFYFEGPFPLFWKLYQTHFIIYWKQPFPVYLQRTLMCHLTVRCVLGCWFQPIRQLESWWPICLCDWLMDVCVWGCGVHACVCFPWKGSDEPPNTSSQWQFSFVTRHRWHFPRDAES